MLDILATYASQHPLGLNTAILSNTITVLALAFYEIFYLHSDIPSYENTSYLQRNIGRIKAYQVPFKTQFTNT
jgi:hypothetical protein